MRLAITARLDRADGLYPALKFRAVKGRRRHDGRAAGTARQ
jgi:hypothetical protein